MIDSDAFIQAIRSYNSFLVVVKGSPDPDALASSFSMKALIEGMDKKASIFSPEPLSLEQNRRFADELKLPIIFKKPQDTGAFDAAVVTDFQSPDLGDLKISIPCAVHIDHHSAVESDVAVDFKLVDETAGSASTLCALLMKDLEKKGVVELTEEMAMRVSTALMYGIQTDTDKYSHATVLDYEAMEYLSARVNHEILRSVSAVPLEKETMKLLARAIGNQVVYKDWLIAGVGFVDKKSRDSIALVADFLLQREKAATVVVFALIENTSTHGLVLDASLRSRSENTDLNDIIKEITEEGGARKFKGAYQVRLDYLFYAPDRDLLWQLVHDTTVEVLKKRRDGMYISEIRGAYKRFRDHVRDFFGFS